MAVITLSSPKLKNPSCIWSGFSIQSLNGQRNGSGQHCNLVRGPRCPGASTTSTITTFFKGWTSTTLKKKDARKEMYVQKEKISIFTSEEKFAQAFSYAGMQRGRTASFLHFTHAGVKNQEQMALQPSLRNLRHTLL